MNPILLSTVFALFGVCSVLGSGDELLKKLQETFPKTATVQIVDKVQELADAEVNKKTASETMAEIRYSKVESTLVLLPEPVKYSGNLVDAFSIVINHSFITNWLADTTLTPNGLGIGCKIFNDGTIRFVIAASYENPTDVEAKGLTAFRNRALELHNIFRAKHKAVPLALIGKDQEIEKGVLNTADVYADKLVDPIAQEVQTYRSYSVDEKYGEIESQLNGQDTVPIAETAAEDICNAWYNTKSGYNFDEPKFEKVRETAPFTQLVWKATTQLNIVISYGTKFCQGGTCSFAVVVGRYYVRGNIVLGGGILPNMKEYFKNVRGGA